MEPNTKLWYFENFNLLDALSMKEKMRLSDRAAMRNANKHEVIYFAEDPSSNIYFLKQGKVKVSTFSEEGKEMILSILGPGEVFGELALAGQTKRDHTAMATEDAIICSISIEELAEMLQKNSAFNLRVIKLIGIRLKKIETRLESMVFKTAPDRIKAFIRDLVDEYGREVGHEKEVKLNLTHQDIANLTATSRQTVTTVLNDLEKDNIILYDRKRILIRDYQALL